MCIVVCIRRRITEEQNRLGLAADNVANAQFIQHICTLKGGHICLAVFAPFLQAGDKVIAEHFVFQHRRRFVNHNKRRISTGNGCCIYSVQNIGYYSRGQYLVLQDFGKVKCGKSGFQIQGI